MTPEERKAYDRGFHAGLAKGKAFKKCPLSDEEREDLARDIKIHLDCQIQNFADSSNRVHAKIMRAPRMLLLPKLSDLEDELHYYRNVLSFLTFVQTFCVPQFLDYVENVRPSSYERKKK